MTKEEALAILKQPDRIGCHLIKANDEESNKYNQESIEALNMAIKALEQQSSEDEIQKEKSLAFLDGCIAGIKANNKISSEDYVSLGVYKQVARERDIAIEQLKELGYSFGEKIRTSEDCISREKAIDTIAHWYSDLLEKHNEEIDPIELLKDLPLVTPTHGTCKECEHWNGNRYCTWIGIQTEADFYCKDFKKRGNEKE